MNVVYLGPLARNLVTQALINSPFTVVPADNDEDLARVMPDASVLITAGPWYTKNVAALAQGAKKLQLIQLTSAGFENIEKFGAPRGTHVCNAADAWSIAVAEHALTMMLTLSRRIPDALHWQQQQQWKRSYADQCRSLYGKTLVVVGYGRIGKQIAQRAKAFAMKVIAVNAVAHTDDIADQVLTIARLPQALAQADIVVAAVPSTPQTVGMFNAQSFAQTQSGAFFINVARGDIVQEQDLYAALKSGQCGGAALDVTHTEPLPQDSPLWTAPNMIITPHVAGAVPDLVPLNIRDVVVDNLNRLAQQQPLKNLVAREELPET